MQNSFYFLPQQTNLINKQHNLQAGGQTAQFFNKKFKDDEDNLNDIHVGVDLNKKLGALRQSEVVDLGQKLKTQQPMFVVDHQDDKNLDY